jgi:DNA adenine methylase
MTITRPALRYAGGKWRDANWIISHFPSHHCYVEPFCGGASVLLRKEPSYFEVLNDKDQEVINFFRVLREDYDKFLHIIKYTPWSRIEANGSIEENDTPLERARKFYVRSWQLRNSVKGGWRFQTDPANGYSIIVNWNDQTELDSIVDRLKKVQFDCDDAIKVIRRYDSPDTLFYIDPPYVLSTRNGRYYTIETENQDHIHLWQALYSVKGKVVLSGYPSELYQEYGKDWRTVQKPSKTNGKKTGTEVLWMNF